MSDRPSDRNRYPTPGERAALAEQQASRERQLREELLGKLRDRGIDPDTL